MVMSRDCCIRPPVVAPLSGYDATREEEKSTHFESNRDTPARQFL